ncbi:MAG: hypothetical protein QOJ42_249 [Acidobacteriaceae bacterium]|nr:hypothetical protein [Acidobacteriaceae bacterium]
MVWYPGGWGLVRLSPKGPVPERSASSPKGPSIACSRRKGSPALSVQESGEDGCVHETGLA